MSEYYVKPSGNDTKDGLSEENAWATVTKALQTLVAGDTCYIAPGTYRNTSGWSVSIGGTSGNPIIFQGDPDCEHFENENPGYVRLTGCDADELPSCAGHVFSYNGRNYVTLKSLILDGMTSGHHSATVYAAGGLDRKAEHCITHGGSWGFRGVKASHCFSIAAFTHGFSQGEADRCMALGSTAGFSGVDSVQCVAMGCKIGFGGSDNIHTNCLSIGASENFYGTTGKNCVAIGGYEGAWGGEQHNCIAVGCMYGFHLGTISSCKALYCIYPSDGTIGEATDAKHIGFTNLRRLTELARWIKPDLFFEKDFGDNSLLPEAEEDFLGQPRRMHDGTIDVGAFEYSDVAIDWSNYKTNPPGVKITRKGVQEFNLPAEKDKAVSVRVWVKFDTGADKPQLILSGNGIATQTDTAEGDGSAFEQLFVSATPTQNTVLTVRLYQRDTTAAKYAIFSDLKVT